MRRLALLILVSLVPTLSSALPSYYPKEFVNDLKNGLKDTALKDALFKILSKAHVQSPDGDTLAENCIGKSDCVQHFSLGYTPARQIMFGRIHLEQSQGGFAIRDVYCNILFDEGDFKEEPPGPDKIPDGKIINTEHTWPQSRFNKNFPKDMQKSDLHILFPTLTKANTVRSNLELAVVTQTLSSPCAGARRGYAADGSRKIYFEPPDEQKGASARAILYFSVRYKMPISQVEEEALKQWNRDYPVTAFDKNRNEQVFKAQQDRNPFVDDPDLVDRVSDF